VKLAASEAKLIDEDGDVEKSRGIDIRVSENIGVEK
jgi:hypothetical protein